MSPSAFVVVLGDLGRSPRMCNHAASLAKQESSSGGQKIHVCLFGFAGSALNSELRELDNVSPVYMSTVPQCIIEKLPKLVVYGLKIIWQTLALLWAMTIAAIQHGVPSILVLQNPPSIPSLPACIFFTKVLMFSRTKMVVDWHNYGHTIMALAHSREHPLVRFSKVVESVFGRRADLHFCVSKAMKSDLFDNWNVNAVTLYDRPANCFRSLSASEKKDFFDSISSQYEALSTDHFFEKDSLSLKDDRPGILISSTSWTEDEDFSILLNALKDYEIAWKSGNPDLICIITGKGPLKDFYRMKIQEMNWKHVRVILPWLEPDDYPKLLACADLGVSLHTSSSGLDLPMKVVDMFGCGLPVCALDFPAMPELVIQGKNGMIFTSPSELSKQICDWFKSFPNNPQASKFREALKPFQAQRWHAYWQTTAWPLLEACFK